MTAQTATPIEPATRPSTPRDARRTRRLLAAVLLPVAPLSVAVLRTIFPSFSASDTTESLELIAANTTAQEVVAWLGVVMSLTMVPAILAAVRLARRRRPVLAVVTAGVNLVAYLGAGPLFAADMMALVAARPEYGAGLTGYIDDVMAHPANAFGLGAFIVGHIVGMILLGALLWRIIPRWASVALIVSQPLHFVAFVILGVQPLDGFAWLLTAAGFAACAYTLVRTPDDDWDLPPVTR
ncbi:hypothetical protein GCM10009557_68400 [Virgisporangium ochraceum]|uniref:Uncharacterized protein n=1 Tax=Virgisporangium ochraceum TaxID=65505 RepID=A0A8J4EHR2_9ACTN|nr:hypothetical protein [Virgisporangium ochraceum]GIJ74998.1 hypothetical protein Voc01_099150 [Virgisporangium ochraceum]